MAITADQARIELAKRELAKRGVALQPKQGFAAKAWNALGAPERMSRQGLQSIASMIPEGKVTGNLPMDLARGTPRIAANTLAQAAPGFVSPGAILGAGAGPVAGALGKSLAPVGRTIASNLEDWSGIKPGSLSAASKDASLLFAKGKKGAQPYYQSVQEDIQTSPLLDKYSNNKALVNAAYNQAKAGKLSEGEALEARKAADKLRGSKSINQNWLMSRRSAFDDIVKKNQDLSQGDTAYKRGIMAESMRSFFPKNVGGRASPFKVGEALAMGHMFGPAGKALGAMTSPIALGAGATGGGLAARTAIDPRISALIGQLISKKNADTNP